MTPAARLITLVKECAASGVGRRAILLRADRLPSALARPHHLRLAEAALTPLLQADRAQAFRLVGPRFAVVWRGDAEDAVLQVVSAIQTLLQDAPPDAPDLTELLGLYELPEAGEMLLAAIETPGQPPAAAASLPAEPLDTAMLDALEATLSQADLSRFVRRRMIWDVASPTPKPAWDYRFVHTRSLAAELTPGRDVRADPWLFRRLTHVFDRRMMSFLAVPGSLAGAGPFGFDLNVASILSPGFLRFDGMLPARLRGGVVLSLTIADILADPAAFAFARGFARARQYRLLLRGVTPASADLLSLAALDLDHHEVRWSAKLPGIAASVLSHGRSRIVLSHADEPSAVAWARSAGIGFNQGAAMPQAPSIRLVHPTAR